MDSYFLNSNHCKQHFIQQLTNNLEAGEQFSSSISFLHGFIRPHPNIQAAIKWLYGAYLTIPPFKYILKLIIRNSIYIWWQYTLQPSEDKHLSNSE